MLKSSVAGLFLVLGSVAHAGASGELLTNGSFDASDDGKAPSGWMIATDQKTVYREIAVLSADKVLEILRDHTTRTLWQPISGKTPKKLCFRFDATPLRYKVYLKYADAFGRGRAAQVSFRRPSGVFANRLVSAIPSRCRRRCRTCGSNTQPSTRRGA